MLLDERRPVSLDHSQPQVVHGRPARSSTVGRGSVYLDRIFRFVVLKENGHKTKT
jgi:hypothetical protein